MKRRLFLFLSLSCCAIVLLALTHPFIDSRWTPYQMASEIDPPAFNRLDALVHYSPVIVEINAVRGSETDRSNEARPVTKTNVIVSNVIKDGMKQGIREGDSITVLEGYYAVDRPGFLPGRTLFTYGNYTRLLPNATYLLFLLWSDANQAYSLIPGHAGKMNLDGKDRDETRYESQSSSYSKLKSEAIARYRSTGINTP